MKNKIFRKSLAFVLSLAMIISAMSCLLLVPAAAAPDYSKLTATYDFDNNGSAADFVQVGGKTGDETAEGYTSWNYDPEVAMGTGYEKYTIAAAELDYSDENTVKAVSSKSLIAKPYLNNAEGVTAQLGNLAASATATSYVSNHGVTSIYTLGNTVDENGVALESIDKNKISGSFAFDFYEMGKTHNSATVSGASPILIYYYKDANNWRGFKFNVTRKSEVSWNSGIFTAQHIVCESDSEGKVYTYQGAMGWLTNSTKYAGSFADPSVIRASVLDAAWMEENVWKGATPTARNTYSYKTNGAAYAFDYYPTTSTDGAYLGAEKCGEWLDFSIEYLNNNYVAITLKGKSGFPVQYMVPGTVAYDAYAADGTTVKTSVLDLSKGTFGLAASYSVGNNTARGAEAATQQPAIPFDNIAVDISDSTDQEAAEVTALIAAITDKTSYEAAAASYAAFGRKAAIKNAGDLDKWANYFSAKRINYDFSNEAHKDILDNTISNITALSGSFFYEQKVVNKEGDGVLHISDTWTDSFKRSATYLNVPSALVSDIESVTIDIKGGLSNNPLAYLTANSNGIATLAMLNADKTFANNANTALRKLRKDATTGNTLVSAWNSTGITYLYVDLQKDFSIKLTKASDTSTKVSFIGTELVLNEETSVYEAGANNAFESASVTYAYPIDRVALAFGQGFTYDVTNVDVKFTGWESVVNLTAEEEALAARIVAIPEITINNYATVNTEVSAIRAAVDALGTTALADKMPEGSELTYIEILAAAEAKIATFTGDVASAQAFVDDNNAVLNIATANVTEANAQSIIDVHTAYEALSDAVKSILANNYALLDNDATGEKCFDIIANLKENYAIAIPLAPTEAQTAFLEHYAANGIGALTAAEGKMDILDASITLYNAVEETHKPNVQAKYNYILDLLDKHFIKGNKFTYNAADIEGCENITAYFNNTIFNESTTAIDENRTKNNKTISADKFHATSATNIKLVQDYAVPNAAGDYFITGIGFDFFPKVANLGDISGTSAGATYKGSDYFYQSGVATNKPTMYVDGVNVASSTDKKGLNQIYYTNSFKNSSNGTLRQHFANRAASGPFTTGEFNTSFQYTSSRFVHFYGDYYMLPGDRIVYDIDYTINYSPALVAGNGQTYKSVTINFTKFDIWVENSANDNVEGYTAYTYDAPVDGGIAGDIKLGQIAKNTTVDVGYTYGEDELALPQLYLDDHSLQYTQRIEITRKDTFTDKYEDALDKTFTEADAAEVIEIAKDYQSLTASEKAINAEAVAKAEAAITAAGLRPTSKGSTLSVGANTSIGFRAVKPAVSNYDKFGIIVTTFNRMNTKGDKELTLADADVKNYAKAYAMDYTEGANRSEELTFNVYGLFDADVAENVDPWGIWLVARYYTVYKAADGTEVTIYSTNDFGNTPTGKDAAETATLNAIAANGQLIRSINGIIRSMADTLYAAKATYATEVGADYVDGYGNPMNNYTGTTLAAAYGDDTDGLLSTAAETLYFMKAFKGVFTKILAQNS